MIDQLRKRLQERQGRMFLGTRAASLRVERGRVVGIDAETGGVGPTILDAPSHDGGFAAE